MKVFDSVPFIMLSLETGVEEKYGYRLALMNSMKKETETHPCKEEPMVLSRED
jgi:hypothetical protein